MVDVKDFLSLDSYKALVIMCERLGYKLKDIVPDLKICWSRTNAISPSLFVYKIVDAQKPELDEVLFFIQDGKYYDSKMEEIDISKAVVNRIDRKHYYNQMEKSKSEIVLLTFK